MNLESTLKTLSYNSKPFFPKDRKEESKVGVKEGTSEETKNMVKIIEEVKKTTSGVKGENAGSVVRNETEEMNKKIEIRLKDINLAEIKEFYPKNFKMNCRHCKKIYYQPSISM